MTAPQIAWLIVGVGTMLTLTTFVLLLVRQVRRLTSSVVEFQREVLPVLESIQRDAQAAQEHAERVQQQAEALQAMRDGNGRSRSRPRARR